MEIKNKGVAVNQLLIVISGTLILLGSILIYLYILQGVYGRFSITQSIPTATSIKNFFGHKKTNVAILYSKYTENMLPKGSTWLADNVATWKRFLNNNDINYSVIADSTIEKGFIKDFDLIILPGSKSLSEKQFMEIKKFIDRGGSIFSTGGTGSFSQDGKWRGWTFFKEVYGTNFTYELNVDEISKIHTLRGNLPLTANIPTGYPLKIATWDIPIAVQVMDPRTTQVSFWYNYRLEDGLVRENIKETAGITYGSYGNGRFVWFGFELMSVIGVQEDYIYFDRLLSNSLKWLLYRPIAYIKDWPNGFEAATLIVPTIQDRLTNIQSTFDVLSSEKVKASFFVEPELGLQYPSLLKNIIKHGDLGALVDIGFLESVNDTINKLNDYLSQLSKFVQIKDTLEKVSGGKVEGMLPFYGLYDEHTVKALIDAGYKYVLTDSLTDRSVPNTLIREKNTLISMTKTARDDYEIIRDFGLTQPNFQLYTYKEDVDRILFEGGMYILKLHSEFGLKPEYSSVLRDLVRDMKEKKMWIASASEIISWWMKRSLLEIRVDQRGENRIALTISNRGAEVVNDLVVHVDMQVKAKNINITSEIIGTKLPVFKLDELTRIMYLSIRDLKPGESRLYYIDYDSVNV